MTAAKGLRRRHKIDWTKPFKGANGSTSYDYIRTVTGAGEFCHVIKSNKKSGLCRMVNDYGDDIGGAHLVSQRPPKKEPAPKSIKPSTRESESLFARALGLQLTESMQTLNNKLEQIEIRQKEILLRLTAMSDDKHEITAEDMNNLRHTSPVQWWALKKDDIRRNGFCPPSE
jgi:hypothetical protein